MGLAKGGWRQRGGAAEGAHVLPNACPLADCCCPVTTLRRRFAMVGYMRIFMGAAKDRLESLVVSPRATTLAHIRALALVVVILVHDVAGMAALLSSVNSMSITKVRRVGEGLNLKKHASRSMHSKKHEACYMARLSCCPSFLLTLALLAERAVVPCLPPPRARLCAIH